MLEVSLFAALSAFFIFLRIARADDGETACTKVLTERSMECSMQLNGG